MAKYPDTPMLDTFMDGNYHRFLVHAHEMADDDLHKAFEEAMECERHANDEFWRMLHQTVHWVDVTIDENGIKENFLDSRNAGPIWGAVGQLANWAGTRRILGTEQMRRQAERG